MLYLACLFLFVCFPPLAAAFMVIMQETSSQAMPVDHLVVRPFLIRSTVNEVQVRLVKCMFGRPISCTPTLISTKYQPHLIKGFVRYDHRLVAVPHALWPTAHQALEARLKRSCLILVPGPLNFSGGGKCGKQGGLHIIWMSPTQPVPTSPGCASVP